MKSSIKGFFVTLAIVMSFVIVQGVYARDLDNFEVATYEGVVTSVNTTTRAIVLDTYPDLTFDQMGPLWYWDDVVGIPYPTEEDQVAIDAFYIDCLGVYVGVQVCYTAGENVGRCILLRNVDTLKPLWNLNVKTTDLSDTAAEATGDGGPIKYDYDHNYDNDYDHNYESSGPHGK
jgi:hypothetical protein